MNKDDPQDHGSEDDLRAVARFGAHLRVRATAGQHEAGTDCPDDHLIAAFADGTIAADARSQWLPHVAMCGRCRTAIASVARTIGDRKVAREIDAAERPAALPARHRAFRRLLPIAAAAALILAVWPRTREEGPPAHRSTAPAALSPIPTSPIGSVARPAALRWRPVAGADRYRVILFNADSRVVYEQQLSDTILALPDSVTLTAGATYIWKVEARTGWDRWESSPLVEFVVGRSR
jgi:anti-sigma factor ChrR (cupin superfamily)